MRSAGGATLSIHEERAAKMHKTSRLHVNAWPRAGAAIGKTDKTLVLPWFSGQPCVALELLYFKWYFITFGLVLPKVFGGTPVAHVGTNNWWQKNFWQVTTMQIESRYMNQPSEKTQWAEIISGGAFWIFCLLGHVLFTNNTNLFIL